MTLSRLISLAALALAGALALGACATPNGAKQCVNGTFCPADAECSGDGTTCIFNKCGNAIANENEECDDGNVNDGDGCSSDCALEICGDGSMDFGEICDDGNTVNGDGCAEDCLSRETCGNDVVDVRQGRDPRECSENPSLTGCAEACDDGNQLDGDGCAKDCLSFEICGNGIKNAGEKCDDGNTAGGDACSPSCKAEAGCPSGEIDVDGNNVPIEECDDGNSFNTDDCVRGVDEVYECKIARCGDSFVASAATGPRHEECDGSTNPLSSGPVETAACDLDCTMRSCGDGTMNRTAGEQCDNGAGNSLTGDCLPVTCLRNVCGDGNRDMQGAETEECDDGNDVNNDGCNVDCRTPQCGNGVVDMGETCDLGPGNNTTTSACPNCQVAVCGDNHIRAIVEQCDGGNTMPGDGCSPNCRIETCGNGTRDPNEGCDDGNVMPDDGCSPLCVSETCGDGVINDVTEDCDPGAQGENATCNIDCTTRACGDGKLNLAAGEQCDNGMTGNGPNKDCNAQCHLNVCGDNDRDMEGPQQEACDDGDEDNNDGCNVDCRTPACGNGIQDMNEPCDDGNTTDTDACVSCVIAFCGDGKVRMGVEQCDDGDTENGDGCDNNCRSTGCGNGIKTGTEACDDGNMLNGDGCSMMCQLERCGNNVVDPGEQCDPGPAGETMACNRDCTTRMCGDGKVNATAGEQCDDGATAGNTDDCLNNCQVNTCGDTFQDLEPPDTEGCDDGNNVNNDGCNIGCTLPSCGNGIVEMNEQCDLGGLNNDTGICTSTCRHPTCGDTFTQASNGEQCDDGQASGNLDNCLNTCKLNTCGDTHRDMQTPVTEQCDDGNAITEQCAYETACTVCNATCQSVAGVVPRCGDGIIQFGIEACDDGNDDTCGTCSEDCLTFSSERAVGFIITVQAADIVANDRFTLNDGTISVTFEYTVPPGMPGSGNTAVPLTPGMGALQVATATSLAINTHATLKIGANVVGSFVRVTHDQAGVVGNRVASENVANPNFSITNLEGGTGGNCSATTGCESNADCSSGNCMGNTAGAPGMCQ